LLSNVLAIRRSANHAPILRRRSIQKIMTLISLLFTNPVLFAILAVLLLYSVIAHETAHGFMAHLFGDDTAKMQGRLTFNPVSHLDIVGTLMLFLVGFGWAKPVPVDYRNLRHARLGLLSVSMAGCAVNILIAMSALFLLRFNAVNANPMLSTMLYVLFKINVILGAFNLLPIPPLDGSRIVASLLPEKAQRILSRIEPYGLLLLIFLLFTGLMNPLISFMQHLIYNIINIVFNLFR